MAGREKDSRLEEIRNNGGTTYSISRLNCINQCKHQAYLNYIKQAPKRAGIYGLLGSAAHDKIEECIKGIARTSEIKECILDELENLDMIGIEFPKDRNGNNTIRDNWTKNMLRFAEEFTVPDGDFKTEELLILPLNEKDYMIGYADAIRYNESNNSVYLIDWKTSSAFTGDHLIEAGRQLIIYKLALEYMGYKVDGCAWCMLKYCETTWKLKNGKTRSKVSEWRNLIKDMRGVIEKALLQAGYDDMDVDFYISNALSSNSWKDIPEDVRNQFHTDVYYREYEITQDLIDETMKYINDSIKMYESLTESNATSCDISKNGFYCSTLCDFGGKTGQCKYWMDYCATFSKEEEDDDIF